MIRRLAPTLGLAVGTPGADVLQAQAVTILTQPPVIRAP